VVADVIASAFDSAGQRCSALRILCLQEDIADRTLAMLKGALAELRVGRTDQLAVDIGPVITAEAQSNIEQHIAAMRGRGREVIQRALPDETAHGTFVAPTIIELHDVADVTREVFGPVLHVVRWRRDGLDALIDAINATGYGLTFGLHTRLDETIAHVTARVKAGNLYINRNVIGAVVGVQPFGGRGLSGTGPKAGGPLYLRRLVQTPPAAAANGRSKDSALADFIAWLDARGDGEAARQARRLGESSAVGREIELPGPVGERNLYALHPRGRILLHPATTSDLYRQIAAVLAAGCEGTLHGMALPADLPASVAARISTGREGTYAAALINGDSAQICAVLHELAQLPGPIVTAHAPAEDGYQVEWLLEEVSISINTTAAGGNASLMMLV
jgi:RHH-type proline utilization regulon transcriptional repressor/proline dehydrogenase/delta 1-pyrroline-5-carboxylate dehydrogenase